MLAGYRCPPGGEEPGRPNAVTYCLSQCSNPCVAPPLLAAMYKADTGNYHNDHTYLSASMLAGGDCARRVLLERTVDFWDVPRKRFWPFRGTIAHALVEGAGDLVEQYGWLQEIRTEVEIQFPEYPAPVFENGEFTGDFDHQEALVIKIRGTADAYNPYTRTLVDFKSQADAKADMMIRGTKSGTFSKNLQDEHVWQTNIYRWLIARTRISEEHRTRFKDAGLPDLKGKNYPAPTNIQIQAFSMLEIPRSGATYAVTKRGATTLYDIDPVPVLPLHEIETYVREKALYWHRHMVLRQPAPVVSKERAWLCNYCAMNGELNPGGPCFPTAERAQQAAQAEQ